MDYLSKFYFKNNFLFGILIKQTIITTTILTHLKGPIHKEYVFQESNLEVKINKNLITKLEKLSLVKVDNEGGIDKLESAIRFAQKLKNLQIDTSVKPMYSVLENEKLELREDKVFEGNCRDKILKNSKLLEDEYFIAPPDNI